MSEVSKGDLPVISFESQEQWEVWLEKHHASAAGLWLKIAKKSSGIESVSYSEAVDGALCFGWIDGQKGAYDDHYWLQRFTPRRPQSKWSKRNRERAAELTEENKIRPAGLQEIELAKNDGRWEIAYDSQANATIPEDLQKRLDENPIAGQFFATLDSKNRYAILYRIQDAKRPETRARRIEKFILMLNEQKKIY